MPVKKVEMKASWRPIRNGEIYCSSACGRNCRYDHYALAVESAAKLVSELDTGWQPDVWENLGWHYKAVKGDWDVRVRDPRVAKIDGFTHQCNVIAHGHQFLVNGQSARDAVDRTVATIEHTILAYKRQVNLVRGWK